MKKLTFLFLLLISFDSISGNYWRISRSGDARSDAIFATCNGIEFDKWIDVNQAADCFVGKWTGFNGDILRWKGNSLSLDDVLKANGNKTLTFHYSITSSDGGERYRNIFTKVVAFKTVCQKTHYVDSNGQCKLKIDKCPVGEIINADGVTCTPICEIVSTRSDGRRAKKWLKFDTRVFGHRPKKFCRGTGEVGCELISDGIYIQPNPDVNPYAEGYFEYSTKSCKVSEIGNYYGGQNPDPTNPVDPNNPDPNNPDPNNPDPNNPDPNNPDPNNPDPNNPDPNKPSEPIDYARIDAMFEKNNQILKGLEAEQKANNLALSSTGTLLLTEMSKTPTLLESIKAKVDDTVLRIGRMDTNVKNAQVANERSINSMKNRLDTSIRLNKENIDAGIAVTNNLKKSVDGLKKTVTGNLKAIRNDIKKLGNGNGGGDMSGVIDALTVKGKHTPNGLIAFGDTDANGSGYFISSEMMQGIKTEIADLEEQYNKLITDKKGFFDIASNLNGGSSEEHTIDLTVAGRQVSQKSAVFGALQANAGIIAAAIYLIAAILGVLIIARL
ncbi:hypothetical protein MACH09_41640 [Vibrio sp. MACH09]|nr:hypothetical protein MACH09_41640 [Vibrio sp. MACH09]